MRDWEEETHPPSFHIHLELWIPKNLDTCENMWNTKQSLCCLLLLPSMQWELNCSIKHRTSKSWSLGTGAGLTSGRRLVRAGVKRGSSLEDNVNTEAKWQEVMGQKYLYKDQGQVKDKHMERYRVCGGGPAHMAVEGTRNKWQKEKSKLFLSPQLSRLSSSRAFKDILVFFWYFLSHQSTSCNFSGEGNSWWIRVRRVRKCHSGLKQLELRGEVPLEQPWWRCSLKISRSLP